MDGWQGQEEAERQEGNTQGRGREGGGNGRLAGAEGGRGRVTLQLAGL